MVTQLGWESPVAIPVCRERILALAACREVGTVRSQSEPWTVELDL